MDRNVSKKARDKKTVNKTWIVERMKEYKEEDYFCFIDHNKASGGVDHAKLWNILKEWVHGWIS